MDGTQYREAGDPIPKLLEQIAEEIVRCGAALPLLYRFNDQVVLLLDPSHLPQTGEMQVYLLARSAPESTWRQSVERLFGDRIRIDRRFHRGTVRISGPPPPSVWERMAKVWAGGRPH